MPRSGFSVTAGSSSRVIPSVTQSSSVSSHRGGHRGGPERGGAGHAEGRPAVAQQRPDPRRPARQVRRDVAPRSCCEGIRRGFKVSERELDSMLGQKWNHQLIYSLLLHKFFPVHYVNTGQVFFFFLNAKHILVSASCQCVVLTSSL